MFFLALSRYLDEKGICTFFPQFLYILLEPLHAITFINVSLFTITLLYLFRVKQSNVGYKTLIIIYFICILSSYINNKVNSYIFMVILGLIGSFLIKKQNLSLLIIPELLFAYIMIKITNNPYIIGILFSIFKWKADYENEVGVNIFLLLFLLFYLQYTPNLLVGLFDVSLNKINIYLLLIVLGLKFMNRVANKQKI